MNMIQAIPGYRSPEDLTIILRYLGEKIYEEMSYDDYLEKMGWWAGVVVWWWDA